MALLPNPNPTPALSSPLPNFSSLNVVKLTADNYPLWIKTIKPYLQAHRLFGYADGSLPPPTDHQSANYLDWLAKDQLVVALLNASLSESVLVQVLECSTAAETWSRLTDLFSATSSAQIIQHRLNLTTLKKGGDSVTDYCNKAKRLVAAITAAGQTVSDSELVIYLLAGLGPEYNAVVTSLSTQTTPPDSKTTISHLMNHESMLARQSSSLLGPPPLSVHTTTTLPPSTPPAANFTQTRGRHDSSRGRGSFYGGRGDSSRGRGDSGRGRGRGGSQSFSGDVDNRPQCQLCRKRGHEALQCWHRFDQAYQAPPPRSFQAHYSSTAPWFPDTAATTHFTPDLSNLRFNYAPYAGTDSVSRGDGSSLSIHNTDPHSSGFRSR